MEGWDGYTPANPAEGKQCRYCARGLEHAVGQHIEEISRANQGTRRQDHGAAELSRQLPSAQA